MRPACKNFLKQGLPYIGVGFVLLGGVFHLMCWQIMIEVFKWHVPELFELKLTNPRFLAWLLLSVYTAQWVVYFIISKWISTDTVWTLRRFVGDHVSEYLREIKGTARTYQQAQLGKLREKVAVTKHTVAVLLSFCGVMLSICILGWLHLKKPYDDYDKVFLYLASLALITAMALLFVSLEALDTAANPIFDACERIDSFEKLYKRGTRNYLMGLALFGLSLLLGLAIIAEWLSAIGSALLVILFSHHNYWPIEVLPIVKTKREKIRS